MAERDGRSGDAEQVTWLGPSVSIGGRSFDPVPKVCQRFVDPMQRCQENPWRKNVGAKHFAGWRGLIAVFLFFFPCAPWIAIPHPCFFMDGLKPANDCSG